MCSKDKNENETKKQLIQSLSIHKILPIVVLVLAHGLDLLHHDLLLWR